MKQYAYAQERYRTRAKYFKRAAVCYWIAASRSSHKRDYDKARFCFNQYIINHNRLKRLETRGKTFRKGEQIEI